MHLIAAPFTALDENGELALEVIEKQAASLVGDLVQGAFVCGSTGEGVLFTREERMAVASRWCSFAGNELSVIVHVGHASIAEACVLAAHAEQVHASAIAAVAPFYFRPSTVEDLVECCRIIAAAAPRTGFFYYHIPSMTGVGLSMPQFLELASARIPTFRGIKFTDENLVEFRRCLEIAGDRHTVHFGRDEVLLPAMTVGARSAVGSTYNFAAPIYLRMADAYARCDLRTASRLQAVLHGFVRASSEHGGHVALKALSGVYGTPCGPCRMPLGGLSTEELRALQSRIEEVGFAAELAASRDWLRAYAASQAGRAVRQ